MTLYFTDPIAAKLYIEEFAPKSINTVDAYLWTPKNEDEVLNWDNSEDFTIREVTVDELEPELIADGSHVRVNNAIYVKGYPPQQRKNASATGGVVIFSHDQSDILSNTWQNALLVYVSSDDALTRLINQLTIEGEWAFNEPKNQE